MNNKYQEYNPKDFEYDYPYTWKQRNKKYLEKRDNRPIKIREIDNSFFNDNEDTE